MNTTVAESMIESLRDTAVLADLTIGSWTGEMTDRDALDGVKASSGATGNIGKVVKNVLAGHDANLKATRSAYNDIRAVHSRLTMPWASGGGDRLRGPRLLPNAQAEDYLRQISDAKARALEALDRMMGTYDADVANAKTQLGTLAPADYPTQDQVRGMFYAKVAIEPLPATSRFTNLPPAFAAAFSRNLAQRQGQMLTSAQEFLWSSVSNQVAEVAARMREPDARFRGALVTNLQELTGRLEGWNLANDPRVIVVRDMIHGVIGGVTPEVLRTDLQLRGSVAAGLASVLAQMDEWEIKP